MADEIMVVNAVEPHGNDEQKNENNAMEAKDDIEDEADEEFATLNAQIDQLNSALDTLEHNNDVIHAEFVKLLKSNRETRQQFQESVKNGDIASKESSNSQ